MQASAECTETRLVVGNIEYYTDRICGKVFEQSPQDNIYALTNREELDGLLERGKILSLSSKSDHANVLQLLCFSGFMKLNGSFTVSV